MLNVLTESGVYRCLNHFAGGVISGRRKLTLEFGAVGSSGFKFASLSGPRCAENCAGSLCFQLVARGVPESLGVEFTRERSSKLSRRHSVNMLAYLILPCWHDCCSALISGLERLEHRDPVHAYRTRRNRF